MNIVVIGTSNSIKANSGMLKYIRREHNVTQLSVGRVPFYYHIKTILQNRELLELSDCVIIDHYVNDMNFYSDKLGAEYKLLLHEFYKLAASLNVHVINILFPIFKINNHRNFEWYNYVLELTRKYRLGLVDLNLLTLDELDYDDSIHIGNEISYHVGVVLGASLNRLASTDRPCGGRIVKSPFSVIEASGFKCTTSDKSSIKAYKNSLIDIKYLDLKSKASISLQDQDKVLSLGYLNPKGTKGKSAIKINNQSFTLDGIGYFHEALMQPFFGDIVFSPVYGKGDFPNLVLRKNNSREDFSYVYLVDILVYSSLEDSDIVMATRDELCIDIDNFKAHIYSIKNLIPKVRPAAVDFLRDYSLSVEEADFSLAVDLMRLAQRNRPDGVLINTKVREFKRKI